MNHILMFSGSNNPNSLNQQLIHNLAAMIDADKPTVINLADYQFPVYSITLEKEALPEKVIALRKITDAFDTIVIAVPEHNGSISAFFKNTMDWLSRAGEKGYKVFTNKNVALLNASPVGGGANALDHAEAIVKRLGATVIGRFNVPKFHDQTFTDENGLHFKDADKHDQLAELAKTITESEPINVSI